MIDQLDIVLRKLITGSVTGFSADEQVRFQPPDDDWRAYVETIAIGGQPASALRGSKTAPAAGRPRSIELDQAILRAAFALFLEHGIAGASIEKIARRAGVAKTSIYRRWPTRDALLAQAIEAARDATAPGYSAEAVERASAEEFLKLLLGIGEVLAKPEIRRLMTRLVGTVPDYPDLLEVYREAYFAPRRRAIVGAFRRAQTAGLLPAGPRTGSALQQLAATTARRRLRSRSGSGRRVGSRLGMLPPLQHGAARRSRSHCEQASRVPLSRGMPGRACWPRFFPGGLPNYAGGVLGKRYHSLPTGRRWRG